MSSKMGRDGEKKGKRTRANNDEDEEGQDIATDSGTGVLLQVGTSKC